MNKTKNRKISAIALAALGILMFAAFSIHLILFKLSLPPWSFSTEGKYVAYGLEVIGFLFSIPVVISLFISAYLIHPSNFEKFSKIIMILSIILAVSGFGTTVLFVILIIINNYSSVADVIMFIFQTLFIATPFWIMGLLAVIASKKNKFKDNNS